MEVLKTNKIKDLRKEHNITQTELANVLGISDRAVGYYEAGEREPDYRTLSKIASYFNVSIDYLLGMSETRNIMTKLEYYRTTAGLSQLELAEKLGMSQQRISAYELGKRQPDLDTLKLFSDFFGITSDELLGMEQNNEEENALNKIFIDKISKLLEENNFTQRELAQKINVTEVTISRYLSGERRPRIEIVNKIADVFNVSIDYLFGKKNLVIGSQNEDFELFFRKYMSLNSEHKKALDLTINAFWSSENRNK